MSFSMIVILGICAWLYLSHRAKAKREADIRNWSVDFRIDPQIKPVTRRLRWKDLP